MTLEYGSHSTRHLKRACRDLWLHWPRYRGGYEVANLQNTDGAGILRQPLSSPRGQGSPLPPGARGARVEVHLVERLDSTANAGLSEPMIRWRRTVDEAKASIGFGTENSRRTHGFSGPSAPGKASWRIDGLSQAACRDFQEDSYKELEGFFEIHQIGKSSNRKRAISSRDQHAENCSTPTSAVVVQRYKLWL